MHHIEQSVRLDPNGVLTDARIVFTGGAGFIGSHAVARLLAAGADVKVIDYLSDYLSTGWLNNLTDAFTGGLTDSDIRVCDVSGTDCFDSIMGWHPCVPLFEGVSRVVEDIQRQGQEVAA